ncbi:hypothetical protein Tco_0945862 [Tanacetum coccineum]
MSLGIPTTDVDFLPKDSPATCRWGKVRHRGTSSLTEKRVGSTSSLGKESLTRLPHRTFSSDLSLGKPFPSDLLLGKGENLRPGKWRLL